MTSAASCAFSSWTTSGAVLPARTRSRVERMRALRDWRRSWNERRMWKICLRAVVEEGEEVRELGQEAPVVRKE